MHLTTYFIQPGCGKADISPNVSQNQDNPQNCIHFCDLSWLQVPFKPRIWTNFKWPKYHCYFIPSFSYSRWNMKKYSFWHNPLWKKSHKPTYSLFSYGTINPPYNNLEHKKWYQLSENHCPYCYSYIFGAKKCHLFIINGGFKPNMASYFKSAPHIYAPFSGLATLQMVNFSLLSIWINQNITVIRWVLRA